MSMVFNGKHFRIPVRKSDRRDVGASATPSEKSMPLLIGMKSTATVTGTKVDLPALFLYIPDSIMRCGGYIDLYGKLSARGIFWVGRPQSNEIGATSKVSTQSFRRASDL
jgi:hypothetical protein